MEYEKNNFLCLKCALFSKCNSPHITGRGNLNSSILVLGEYSSPTDDEQGMPFVGTSGDILNHYLNIHQVDCYITHAVKCKPITGKENRVPTAKEIYLCKAFTIELILEMKPKVILAVGSVAFKQLTKLSIGMEVIRGKEFYSKDFNCVVVPTYHPSHLLKTRDKQGNRDNLLYQQLGEDVELVRQISERASVRRIESKPVTLKDPIDIRNYLLKLKTSPEFAFDIETTGLDHRKDRITDISFCCELGKGIHIKWSDILEQEELFKEVISNDSIKIIQNASFEGVFLHQIGYKIKGTWFDTMLAYHTLNMSAEGGSAKAVLSLDTLSWLLTTEGGYKSILDKFGGIAGYIKQQQEEEPEEEELIQGTLFDHNPDDEKNPDVITEYDKYLLYYKEYNINIKNNLLKDLNLTELEYYSPMDSDVTYRIYKTLKYKIDKDFAYPFYEIIMPLCKVLTQIQLNGIKLDYHYMDKIKLENEKEIELIKKKFFKKIGYEFNINSSAEIMKLMYDKLGLIPDNKFVTKKGKKPAADDAAIEHYVKQKPVLKHIQEYRGLAKETSTYLVGFKEKSDPSTHRVYPDYMQLTATGRSSCFLHTVPKDNKIRNMIIPNKGCKILVADECLTGDTLISTKQGIKYIKNITTKDLVLQENGSYERVLNLFKHGKKEIYELETNLGYKLKLTMLHKIRIIDELGNYIWKRLEEIDLDKDYIVIQPFNLNVNLEYPEFPKIEYNHLNMIKINNPKYINEGICELMGYMTGNGVCTDKSNYISITVCSQDLDVINYLNNIVVDNFDKKFAIQKERRGGIGIRLYSNPLYDTLIKLGYSKKNAPSFLLKCNINLVKAWIRGYFEADGCAKDRITCCSVEKTLIEDIQFILLNLGIVSKIIKIKQNEKSLYAEGHEIVYHLEIKSHWTKKFINEIGFISKRKKERSLKLNISSDKSPLFGGYPNLRQKAKNYPNISELKNIRNKNSFISVSLANKIKQNEPNIYKEFGLDKIVDWGQIYDRCKLITKLNDEETYDIEVENTHSFIANGFVSHNSQVELRVLAQMSNDQNMLKAFYDDLDLHTVTACDILKIDIDKFDKKNNKNHADFRDISKVVNFGISYGLQAYSLMNNVDLIKKGIRLTLQEAQNFIDKYFRTYPNVYLFMQNSINFARQYGYVESLYGRKRYLPKINSSLEFKRGDAERQCSNTIIQSTAGDITAIAMIRFQNWLESHNRKALLIGTVHDSILVECPDEEIELTSQRLIDCMTKDIPRILVPLKVDLNIQDRWTKE